MTIDRLRAVAEQAVDVVFPKRCAGCGRRGTWLCAGCDGALLRFTQPWCMGCGVPATVSPCKCEAMPDALQQVRSVGPFDGWLRGAIVQLKYHGEWARAAHLSPLLAVAMADVAPFDALVPVPLHASRLRQRGFNQSRLLAEQAARSLGVPVVDAVLRTRRTDAQVHLSATDRHRNVAGAFAVNPEMPVAGKTLILVDDVITTGATLAACAEVLRMSGAVSVGAVTLAREM